MLIQAIHDLKSLKRIFDENNFLSSLHGKKESLGEIVFFAKNERNRKVEIKCDAEGFLLFIYIGNRLINQMPERIHINEFEKVIGINSFVRKIKEKIEYAIEKAG